MGVSPFVCGTGAGEVKVDEEVEEEFEEAELVRCAPLRGINILVTSSALIGASTPLPEFHRG